MIHKRIIERRGSISMSNRCIFMYIFLFSKIVFQNSFIFTHHIHYLVMFISKMRDRYLICCVEIAFLSFEIFYTSLYKVHLYNDERNTRKSKYTHKTQSG